MEISETDNELRVIAEVPGLEEKDIEVLLDEGVLTVLGEKKLETEDGAQDRARWCDDIKAGTFIVHSERQRHLTGAPRH